jgi:hypothetical protein
MTREQIFDLWAPPGAIWSPWAKPVLFASFHRMVVPEEGAAAATLDISLLGKPVASTAIVVDLPGATSVQCGVALAAAGYRPVPLFNACPSPGAAAALVDVRSILFALAEAAPILGSSKLAADAPPVFLLDADRNSPLLPAAPGLFDNRSISLPTDFPSAQFLIGHGIQRVVLLTTAGTKPRADLSHTLLRWQRAEIEILQSDGSQPPTPIVVARPSGFRVFFYNFLATRGFIRSPLGGFGGTLPMPSAG